MIRRDFEDATSDLRNLEKSIPKAISSSLTRVGNGVRTDATKSVREDYTIKAGDVRGEIKVDKGKVKSDMMLTVKSKGPNLPLTKFKTTVSRSGVKANVLKTTGLKRIPGAFKMTGPKTKPGVFSRVGNPRLPIKELYGPAVPVMLNKDGVVERIDERARERMQERFDHNINYVLGRFYQS